MVWGTISDNMTQKPLFYVAFLAKRLLDIALPWQYQSVPSDQKLLEKVRYMLKLKVTKFQLPTPNSFWAVLKKNSLGGQIPPQKKKSKIALRLIHMSPADEFDAKVVYKEPLFFMGINFLLLFSLEKHDREEYHIEMHYSECTRCMQMFPNVVN